MTAGGKAEHGAAAPPRSIWGAVLSAVAFLALLGVALFFAPTRLGGDMVYFRVVGTSMQPLLHGGDLAVLRRAEHYQVGDPVAYQDPTLGVVVHSIRAVDGGRFITRGLNRQDDDPYRPSPADIHGKLWLNVPGGGEILRTLQTPRNAMLLLVATGALSALPVRTRLRRRRRTAAGAQPAPRPTPGFAGVPVLGSPVGDSIATLAVVAILGAGAAAFVLRSNGPLQATTTEALIEQTGTWTYGASGVGTGIYDGDRLTTGQPAFTALNRSLPAQFEYTIAPLSEADTVTDVRGEVSVVVELSAINKWSRRIELLPPTPFVGTGAIASATLDIGQLLAIAEAVHEQTGVEFGTYRTHVTAHVRATALANGQPLEQTLTAALPFDLTSVQLLPTGDPKEPIKEITKVARPITQPWSLTIPVVRLKLSYEQLQLLAMALGGGGSFALLLLGGVTVAAWRHGEAALIRARYGHLLVASSATGASVEGRVVTVAAFRELVRVATYEQTFIVDAPSGEADEFLVPVHGSGSTYRYSVPRRGNARRSEAPVDERAAPDAAPLAGWSLTRGGHASVIPAPLASAPPPAAARGHARPTLMSDSTAASTASLEAVPPSAIPPRREPTPRVTTLAPRRSQAPKVAPDPDVPPWLVPPSAAAEQAA